VTAAIAAIGSVAVAIDITWSIVHGGLPAVASAAMRKYAL
jgi:hypothetical protein